MISQEEARARVARGAAHLDIVRPGWFNRIDIGTLTLHDPCGCIVGQLCGRYTGAALAELQMAGVGNTALWTSPRIDMGFDLAVERLSFAPAANGEYRPLQDAWIEAIADRRLATQPTVADIPHAVAVTR